MAFRDRVGGLLFLLNNIRGSVELQQNTRMFGIVTYTHGGTRAERWQS
jgi:hypothetical protein